MSDGRFQEETLAERLAKYRRLLAGAESDASRYRAEIKMLEKRIERQKKDRSCDNCIEPEDRCVMKNSCKKFPEDNLRWWREKPKGRY